MRITPIDIETRRFPMKFRGFHPEEVSSFLEQIREELEDLLRENAALKERIHKADNEIHRFWEMQNLLSKTLQDAHQMSEEYKLHAGKEADDLQEKSEETVRDIIGEAQEKALQANEQIIELKMIRKDFYQGMREILRRFDAAITEETVFQEGRYSHEAEAAESLNDVLAAAEAEERLIAEDQKSIVEGHGGEEGRNEAEEY